MQDDVIFQPTQKYCWYWGFGGGPVFWVLHLGFFYICFEPGRFYYKSGFCFGLNRD